MVRLDRVHAPVLRTARRRRDASHGASGPAPAARRPPRARGPRETRPPRLFHGQYAASFLRQLGPGLRVRVVHGEVADDDGNGQADGEHACQRAQGAHEHAHVRLGHHVPVAHRGHRHQGPPQPQRDTVEVVVRVSLDPLGVVDQAGEYDDAKHQEEYEQREFLSRRAERLDQDLQSGRVPRQLEQPHDANDAQELEDVGVFQVRGELLQDQVHVEAESGDVVDDVDGRFDELDAIR